ncbi:NUDIX domain-containing protein [Streptomyces sp. H39-C1]|uniref:NUDIX domain-containing protein n=1 Tax=Streptomyces sp. H39-C1 TaxID=3004355 RepID=UPI0022AFBBC0|nr:NUDIX domain-containing protein [Streptomyces sp. H39-C1]MCZ4100751.1 NUDIX domain-containing protein [Streptomyces sp. H39-C1]
MTVPTRRGGATHALLGHGRRRGWELPGGKADGAESLESAAVRELAEETSLIADPGDLQVLAVLLDATRGIPRLTAAVHIPAYTGIPQVTEPQLITEWVWQDPERLPDPLFTPSAHVLAAWWPGLLTGLPPVHTYRMTPAAGIVASTRNEEETWPRAAASHSADRNVCRCGALG